MNMKTVKAFYFATEERKLRYNDNRKIVVGETHSVEGEIKMCRNGLHASKRLIDAIQYAPGNILYLVELSGDMDHHGDKLAARNRKYLAEFDATELVNEFARKQAMINVKKIKPCCSVDEYNSIVRFLETGDESLRFTARRSIHTVLNFKSNASAYAAARSISPVIYHKSGVDMADLAAYHAQRSFSGNKANFRKKQNLMLIEMVEQATGWDLSVHKQNLLTRWFKHISISFRNLIGE